MKTRTKVHIVATAAIVMLCTVLICLGYVQDRDRVKPTQSEIQLERNQHRATDFLKGVIYVKDLRTDGCFALYHVFISGIDREFATAVPCDGIPTNMLVVPDMGTNANTIAK